MQGPRHPPFFLCFGWRVADSYGLVGVRATGLRWWGRCWLRRLVQWPCGAGLHRLRAAVRRGALAGRRRLAAGRLQAEESRAEAAPALFFRTVHGIELR